MAQPSKHRLLRPCRYLALKNLRKLSSRVCWFVFLREGQSSGALLDWSSCVPVRSSSPFCHLLPHNPSLTSFTVASERQTRLVLDDTAFWQAAGLALNDNGLLKFSLPGIPDDLQTCQEDARANGLTWLLAKVFNFLTAGDAMFPEDYSLPADRRLPLGVTQEQLLEKWLALAQEFHAWKVSLPCTFEEAARTNTSYEASSFDRTGNSMEQVWYEVPICAAVMQVYHMASILLLTNQPQESTAIRSTLAARLRNYRTIQGAVLMHAREIRSISLASPSDAVRVHSVLPLFVAGQVFYELQDRAVIEDLLCSIEDDLGCATQHYRDRLRREWDQELAHG